MGTVDRRMCQERIEASGSGTDGVGGGCVRNGVLEAFRLGLDDKGANLLLEKLKGESSIEEIDLRGNVLERVPKSIYNAFPRLKRLKLDSNRIRFLEKECLPDDLEKLSVTNNFLESLDSTTSCPSSLIELRLDGNKLDELKLGPNLPKLRVAAVAENRLVKFDCAQLPALEELDLRGNSISKVSIINAPLSTLLLGRNEIESISEGDIDNQVAKGLRTLDLSSNALIRFEDSAAMRLVSLHTLDLSDNPKLQELPTSLVTLQELEHINIKGCEVLALVDSKSADMGFTAIRTCLRERLLQKALQHVSSKLKASEKKCLRLEKLRSVREDEIETLKQVSQSQVNGNETSRSALETAAKSLKVALENERSRTEALLAERERLNSDLENAREAASEAVEHKKAHEAAHRRVGELDSELQEVRKRLQEQETELIQKEKVIIATRHEVMSIQNSQAKEKLLAESSAEVTTLIATTTSLRSELESCEKLLEAEKQNSHALEKEIAVRKHAALEEIGRLTERIVDLENQTRPKSGPQEVPEVLAHNVVTLAAELAVDRAERDILREELIKVQKREGNATAPSKATTDAGREEIETMRAELAQLRGTLQVEKQQNLRWKRLFHEEGLVDDDRNSNDAVDVFTTLRARLQSLRRENENGALATDGGIIFQRKAVIGALLPEKETSGAPARLSTDTLAKREEVERLHLSAKRAVDDLSHKEVQCLKLQTALEREQELREKAASNVTSLTKEVSKIQADLAVKEKIIRRLRTASGSTASTEEVARLRKELSMAKAFGGDTVEMQHRVDAKVKVLENSLKERSADLSKLQELLGSRERAIALLETKERDLMEQAQIHTQQLREKGASLGDLSKRLDAMRMSKESAETRALQSEKMREEGMRALAMSKRTLEQLTTEHDGLRQKRAALEANLDRQKEETGRLRVTVAEMARALERESAELVRTRKTLAASERREAEQESELGRRGGEVHRLEAITEEQKGKLRWKDRVLEELHERLAEEKLLAASRLDDLNALNAKIGEVQGELLITNEGMERAHELVSAAEERLRETLEAKEGRDTVTEETSARAELATNKLRHTEEQLRAAGEVAAVRERALQEHADAARHRVMELTGEGEAVRKELRACQKELCAKTEESAQRGNNIVELTNQVGSLKDEVTEWNNLTAEARQKASSSDAEVKRKQALLEWKDGEIANLLKRLNDNEERSRNLFNQLQGTSTKLREKDAALATEERTLRELTTLRNRIEAELASTKSKLEVTSAGLITSQETVSALENELKATRQKGEAESYARKELEVELKAQNEKCELVSVKLTAAEATLGRKNELLKLLEASTTQKEGEHTTTLTRLRELEKEFAERGTRLERVEDDLRSTSDELLSTQRQLVEKQEECRLLRRLEGELQQMHLKFETSEKATAQQTLELNDREAKLMDMEERLNELCEEITVKKKREEELAQKTLDQEAECADLKMKLKDAEEAIKAKQTELEHSDREHQAQSLSQVKELDEIQRRQALLENELSAGRQKTASLEGEVAALRERLVKSQAVLEETYKEKSDQRSQLEDAEGTIAKLKVELNMTQRLLKTAENELSSANNRITAEQTTMSTNKSSIEVLQDKVAARDGSVAQLQQYSRFVNSKLHETERLLAEKQQQFDGSTKALQKLQVTVDSLNKTIEDKERQLRAAESSRIDELSSLRSRIRALEDSLEKAHDLTRHQMGASSTSLRENLEEARIAIRERDLRLNDLHSRLDSVALAHEAAKQELLELKEQLIRKDNELLRSRSKLLEIEDAKQSLDSGTRLQLSEIQSQAESVAVRLQRTESDLKRVSESEQKWKSLCERMTPIVKRGQEAEATVTQLQERLAAAEAQINTASATARADTDREVNLLTEELNRQTKLVSDAREECSQYMDAYKNMRHRLTEAIRAGYAYANGPLEDELLDELEREQQSTPPTSDLVQVRFVLDGDFDAVKPGLSPRKILIVGGDDSLGDWSAEAGCELEFVSSSRQQCQAFLPRNASLEYKFVCRNEKDGFSWELGPNRSLTITTESDSLEIHDRYNTLRWQ